MCSMIRHPKQGPVRELNPGPLAPEARIIPPDQQATDFYHLPIYESSPIKKILMCSMIRHPKKGLSGS